MTKRCAWCEVSEAMIAYHDEEWGVPVHDDRTWFEHIILDAFQAGLSWSTILHKRDNFRKAFHGFDPVKVARFDQRDVRRLLADAGIIRNRQKIEASIGNARSFLSIQQEFGTFDDFIWPFVGGAPKQNKWKTLRQIPPRTRESDLLSQALKKRGFKFAGSTICYAFMQAGGMVNDHVVGCHRYPRIRKMRARRRRKR